LSARIPVVRLLTVVLELSIIAWSLTAGYGAMAIAVVHAIAQCSAAVLWLAVGRTSRAQTETGTGGSLRSVATLAAPYAVVETLQTALYNLPLIVVSFFVVDEKLLGNIALPLQIGALLTVLPRSVARATAAHLAVVGRDKRGVSQVLAESLRFVTALGAVIVIGAVSVGEPTIRALFGPGFDRTPALLVFATANLFLIGWFLILIRAHAAVASAARSVLALTLGCLAMAGSLPIFYGPAPLVAPFAAQALGSVVVLALLCTCRRLGGITQLVRWLAVPVATSATAIGVAGAVSRLSPWLGLAGGLALVALALVFAARTNTRRAIRSEEHHAEEKAGDDDLKSENKRDR
jgi:O-antigen/teichoic acid export membrane protein